MNLQKELSLLEPFVCSNTRNQEFLDMFRHQMNELAEKALRVQKPIAF
jgi:hypothetical protein